MAFNECRTDEGPKNLSEGLKGHPSLQNLSLDFERLLKVTINIKSYDRAYGITGESLKSICESLITLESLKTLHLNLEKFFFLEKLI